MEYSCVFFYDKDNNEYQLVIWTDPNRLQFIFHMRATKEMKPLEYIPIVRHINLSLTCMLQRLCHLFLRCTMVSRATIYTRLQKHLSHHRCVLSHHLKPVLFDKDSLHNPIYVHWNTCTQLCHITDQFRYLTVIG